MKNNINDLKSLAKEYRSILFEKFLAVGQGHPGSTFSMLDIVIAIYHGGIINFNADKKKFDEKILISKGHATVALYPILVKYGVIPREEWDKWGTEPSQLRVFGNNSIPGIDVTSGSLGHGVGVGAGIAISNKRSNNKSLTYSIISEGELYEGSTWEALLFAVHYKLDNLVIVIDINNLIILGETDDCLSLNPISDKMQGLGLNVIECDGHNYDELINAFNSNKKEGVPTCILANTIKGKGFSIMENKPNWHYWNPISADEIELCRKEAQ
tara:strand:+ start:448 stop:1257 length:810 start_codon:yes stop_codon:yes gene_type:complete